VLFISNQHTYDFPFLNAMSSSITTSPLPVMESPKILRKSVRKRMADSLPLCVFFNSTHSKTKSVSG